MVCFQYKKLGCFELSILNGNRTISWTQRLNWFSLTSVHLTVLLSSATTVQVIYSALYRFRGGENGFFTNCFYARDDAVINMAQWYQAAELIDFQDFSSRHGPPTPKSILRKCSVSRTTVCTEWQIFRCSSSFYRQSWALWTCHCVPPLNPHSHLLFFPCCLSCVSKNPGVVLDVSLLLSLCAQTIATTLWLWAYLRFGLAFHSCSPSSDHRLLPAFLLWGWDPSLVLQCATEEIFLPCDSEQSLLLKLPVSLLVP